MDPMDRQNNRLTWFFKELILHSVVLATPQQDEAWNPDDTIVIGSQSEANRYVVPSDLDMPEAEVQRHKMDLIGVMLSITGGQVW